MDNAQVIFATRKNVSNFEVLGLIVIWIVCLAKQISPETYVPSGQINYLDGSWIIKFTTDKTNV